MNRIKQADEIFYSFCPHCQTKLNFKLIDQKSVLSCPKCSFIFWNNPKPVVSAIIKKNKQILLVKRKGPVYKNYWALPGGVIDFLEEPSQAIKREVKEETGLIINRCQLLDAYLIVYPLSKVKKRISHTSIDLIYSVFIKQSQNKLTAPENEIEEVKFFHLNKLPKNIAFKHRKMIIKHALEK